MGVEDLSVDDRLRLFYFRIVIVIVMLNKIVDILSGRGPSRCFEPVGRLWTDRGRAVYRKR